MNMTVTEQVSPTERTELTAYAVELGWAVNHTDTKTVFGYDGRRLTVWWSTDGTAERARLRGQTVKLTMRSPARGTVGDWVRHQLLAWRIEYFTRTSHLSPVAEVAQ